MLVYKQADSDIELRQILALQRINLPKNLTEEEMSAEGFLTVEHSFELIKEMNEACKHTIAVDSGKVVGYALSMHPKFAEEIAVLKPMFHEINKIIITGNDYLIMGQICIAKTYRGKGLFRGLYKNMKALIFRKYTKIITEVDAKNIRSLNAHQAIGFKKLEQYQADDKEWYLIVL
ncbi:GNAT family N-acetyltransferase [uncultured Croceitalea sp.]|uniref:GNAT family N-acetyltransferase n=1 Tax=uncultured Croceitalea sp. TaxID=1798908 RepID=UPI003305EDA0